MGKFALITKGKRATKPVTFPFGEGTATCAVRPLSGSEEALVLSRAREFAVSRGVAEPDVGNELYEFGRWVWTVAIACVDADNPDASYFDSAEEVLEHLDRDRIVLLFELQQRWQDDCSPSLKSLSAAEYKASVVELALAGEDDELPFDRWAPALRRSWVRTTARLLATSLEPRSVSG